MNKTCTYFLLGCLICRFQFCFALITVNSVSVTTSTCPNNGTATIYASSTSDSAVFLYNIVAGPVLYPLQNDSTFSSLSPGTYTAWVHDINSYDSTETTFTITGNYTAPVISAIATSPLCSDSEGQIIGTLQPGTGLGPFNWEITSPDSIAPQASDTFNSLAPGEYLIKITDACNVARTSSAVIDSGGTELSFNGTPVINFIGCDTLVLYISINLNKSKANLPLKLSIGTSSGVSVKSVIPAIFDTSSTPSVYLIYDTIYNINYGDYLSLCITDTCNETICSNADTIPPFAFYLSFISLTENCISGSGGIVSYLIDEPTFWYNIYTYVPFTVLLKNIEDQDIVDSFVENDYQSLGQICNSCPILPPQPDTVPYQLTVKDNCGNIFQDTIHWVPANEPTFNIYTDLAGCLDSTAGAYFSATGFGSGWTLELLSGPAISESTKPGYAYRDTLIYPVTFPNINAWIVVSNLPAGTYTCLAYDSCGNTRTDSFTISAVNSFGWNFQVENNCGGLSNLNMVYNTVWDGGTILVTNVDSIFPMIPIMINDSFLQCQSLNPGKYAISIPFGTGVGSTFLPGNNYCWVYKDTITIAPYNDSTFKATDIATCNGTSYIHIEVDSSGGILPFQYEIISGPETFAPQDSSNFIVNYFGTYLLGVIDSCGSVDTRQVTIDSGRFEPVAKSGGSCAGSEVQLSDVSSPFFTYIWQKPGGSFYTGDTLTINPFTSADTGLYLITKIVQINSCRDTAYGNYHLVFQDTFQQSASICPGDTLRVGSHIHTTSGTYADTLTGSGGCDSIEVTKLIVQNLPVTIDSSGSPVCHNQPITLTATAPGGISYVWSTFQYTEGITVDPSATTTYTVTVNTAVANCSGTASITVYPVSEDTVLLTQNKTIICPTDSAIICASSGFTTYNWNVGYTSQCITVSQPGDYYVTATNSAGCPFVSGTEHLSVYPTTSVSLTVHGDTITSLNQEGYQWYLNNDPILGDTTATIIARISGAYTVQLTDSNGCTNTSNPVIISGINNILTGDEIKVYPNPTANGTWQVEISTSLIGSACEVFDAEGRLVYSGHLNSPKSTVAMQVLSGVYIMKIQSATGNYSVKLIQF